MGKAYQIAYSCFVRDWYEMPLPPPQSQISEYHYCVSATALVLCQSCKADRDPFAWFSFDRGALEG